MIILIFDITYSFIFNIVILLNKNNSIYLINFESINRFLRL